MREKTFEKLYGVASTGKIKTWEIKVEEENDVAKIIILSGYIDGKITPKEKKITEGKNIGKANETTPFTQAVSEAESQWRKKRDQNYELEVPNVDNYKPRVLRSMKFKRYQEHKDKLKFPCVVSPKLNGINGLATISKEISFSSRGGKLIKSLGHINDELHETFQIDKDIINGEIYKPGWSLQEINSRVAELKEDSNQLEFWIFDIVNNDKYENRLKYLQEKLSNKNMKYLKLVPTFIVNNEDEIEKLFNKFVKKHGFEGLVIRNLFGLYKCGFKSSDVLKYKDFIDDEFPIIGGKEGTGQDEGCVIFRCKTKEGKEFEVRPIGSVEQRKEYFTNLKNYIGKLLTVRFQEWSDDKIPLQVSGREIREDFDVEKE